LSSRAARKPPVRNRRRTFLTVLGLHKIASGYRWVGAMLALAAVAQQQDPGPGIRAGGAVPRAQQLL